MPNNGLLKDKGSRPLRQLRLDRCKFFFYGGFLFFMCQYNSSEIYRTRQLITTQIPIQLKRERILSKWRFAIYLLSVRLKTS